MVLEDEALERIERIGGDERAEALLAQLPADQAQAIRARVIDERDYDHIAGRAALLAERRPSAGQPRAGHASLDRVGGAAMSELPFLESRPARRGPAPLRGAACPPVRLRGANRGRSPRSPRCSCCCARSGRRGARGGAATAPRSGGRRSVDAWRADRISLPAGLDASPAASLTPYLADPRRSSSRLGTFPLRLPQGPLQPPARRRAGRACARRDAFITIQERAGGSAQRASRPARRSFERRVARRATAPSRAAWRDREDLTTYLAPVPGRGPQVPRPDRDRTTTHRDAGPGRDVRDPRPPALRLSRVPAVSWSPGSPCLRSPHSPSAHRPHTPPSRTAFVPLRRRPPTA